MHIILTVDNTLLFLTLPLFSPFSLSISAVLLLSYKNHALDEFLCDVISFDPNMGRPGRLIRTGKPEREELARYTEK